MARLLVFALPTFAYAKTLFVMASAPRSGTEWLRSMLHDHPKICCDGELLLKLNRQGGSPDHMSRALKRVLDAFARG